MTAGRSRASFAPTFEWIEGAVLLLVAPCALFPSPTRFVALLAVPGMWFFRWIIARGSRSQPGGPREAHFIPRTPLDAALAVLAGMVLVSLFATYDINASLPKIAGVVFGLAAYYAAAGAASASRRRLEWAVALYLGLGVVIAGVALLGTRWPAKFAPFQTLIGHLPAFISGLPGAERGFHGNEVGGSLLWFIPLALSLWVAALKPLFRRAAAPPVGSDSGTLIRAVALGLTAGFLLLAFVLAQSRGAAIALGAALIFMLACLGRKGLMAAIAVGVAAAGSVWLLGLGHVAEWIFTGGSFATRSVRNFAGRLELWSRAILFIQDHPFTGIGMNTFRSLLQVVYPTRLIAHSADVGHAHSQWLQAALDLGIPGLVAYLAVWVAVAAVLWRTWRLAADPWLRAVTLGLGGSLAAYFVFGLADAVALGAKPGVAFWLLLALCVAAWQVAETGGPGAHDA